MEEVGRMEDWKEEEDWKEGRLEEVFVHFRFWVILRVTTVCYRGGL